MVSSLERFNRKPKYISARYWKGPGVYYHRGHGVWTKYSLSTDKRRGGKVGRGNMKHTHDRKR
ncbi:MAG: hypothetical protein Q8P20_07980 [bacterium]|nr:hypothetical protein [bacterium]